MNGVRAVADYVTTVVGAAALLLGKHHRRPVDVEPYGLPCGALAPWRWLHCPRCGHGGYVLAPGGHIPPCPCISDGDPS